MNVADELKKHFEEDRINFKKIEDQFSKLQDSTDKQNEHLHTILVHIKTSNEFMENLSGINDVVKGVKLFRRPSLWILAFVLGIVALTGGLKTLLAGILGWAVGPK